MIYDYDKDGIKNSLTIEQVNELVAELGGEPQIQQQNAWNFINTSYIYLLRRTFFSYLTISSI